MLSAITMPHDIIIPTDSVIQYKKKYVIKYSVLGEISEICEHVMI
jgi:hypothetical protein